MVFAQVGGSFVMAAYEGDGNAARITFLFIKFFSEEAHAQQFLDGNLLFRPLAYFRQVEERDGRGDPAEGIFGWWQPKGIQLYLKIPEIPEIRLQDNDLAGPVSFGMSDKDPLYIHSLYTLGVEGVRPLGGNQFACDVARRDEIDAQFRIDERCYEFGNYAVLVPVGPFIERIKFVREFHRVPLGIGHVEYYDEETFNGQFTDLEAPYRKQKRFSYQNEFRICLKSENQGEQMRFVQLGSLRSFAKLAPAQSLQSAIRVEFVDA